MRRQSGRVYTAIAYGPRTGPFLVTRRRRFPSLTGRLSSWRWERANLRRTADQIAAVDEIRPWLEKLVGSDGSIESFDLEPRDARLSVTVQLAGRRRLTFTSVDSWFHIEPRDRLTASVLDALRSVGNVDNSYYLGGYADESDIMSYRSRADDNH